MKNSCLTYLSLMLFVQVNAQTSIDTIRPSKTEVVNPIRKVDFNNGNQCPESKQGGNHHWVQTIAGVSSHNHSKSKITYSSSETGTCIGRDRIVF